MSFEYKWTTRQRNATHAIQKKDTAGRKAGKEIEDVNEKTRQTSDTHFFLKIDHEGFDIDIEYINVILRTITYEYVYKGTNIHSLWHYLTKEDLDKIIQNIKGYHNKIVKIEVTKPKKTRNETDKEKRDYAKDFENNLIKDFGEERAKRYFDLFLERLDKGKDAKRKKQEIKKQIKKLKDDFALYDKKTNAEIIKLEKRIVGFFTKRKKTFNRNTFEKVLSEMIEEPTIRGFLKDTEQVAKTLRQIDEANKRQKEWRARKNAESGKPKRSVGRPKKNET